MTEHETYTNYNSLVRLGVEATTKGDLNSTHLEFYYPVMQTPSVEEVYEHLQVSSLIPVHILV